MKKVLLLALITGSLLTSCTKKNASDDNQLHDPNSITINGTDYPTVKIGSQTWTSLNYNGPGGVNYNNVTGNLIGSGKLYTFSEATAIQLPSGWRLPTREDVTKLLLYTGGTKDAYGDGTATGAVAGKLAMQSWPSATSDDALGFHAYPFGYYHDDEQSFKGRDELALFWTSSPVPAPNDMFKYGFGISNYLENGKRTLTAYLDFYKPVDKLSLRFVKDN